MENQTVTITDIEHLAELSGLKLSDIDKKVMLEEVIGILDMFNGCADADENAVIFGSEISIDDLREDSPKASLSKEAVFMNTPRCDSGYVVVPKVVD